MKIFLLAVFAVCIGFGIGSGYERGRTNAYEYRLVEAILSCANGAGFTITIGPDEFEVQCVRMLPDKHEWRFEQYRRIERLRRASQAQVGRLDISSASQSQQSSVR